MGRGFYRSTHILGPSSPTCLRVGDAGGLGCWL